MRKAMVLVAAVLAACAPNAPPRAPEPVPAPSPHAKPKAPPEIVYVKAGRLFDGTGDSLKEHVAIVIEGGRIRSIGPEANVPAPAGARVVDLSRAVVLPGLIDCHVHLAHRADQWEPI